MQNFRQISLIGLRGCFPVVHCDIIARPSDLPVFCFNSHVLLVTDLPVASFENLGFSARVKCEIVSHDRTSVDTTRDFRNRLTVLDTTMFIMLKSSNLILIMYILYKTCILVYYAVNTIGIGPS